MPYKVVPKDAGFDIVNEETGEVKDHRENKEDADRLVRLLHKAENSPEWETANG